MKFSITKLGFEERIVRNMGIDPGDELTREEVMNLFSEEAKEDAKQNKFFDEALEQLVKDKILIRTKEGKYTMNIDNPDFDC